MALHWSKFSSLQTLSQHLTQVDWGKFKKYIVIPRTNTDRWIGRQIKKKKKTNGEKNYGIKMVN